MNFRPSLAALCLCLVLLPLTGRAAGLTGTSVAGTLRFGGNPTNFFDPANGFVPAGYLNAAGTTVTIGSPAVEFGFSDEVNTDLVQFSATQFTIEDVLSAGASSDAPFVMTFTDTAFTGLAFNKVSDSFPNGGLAYSLVGNQITIAWAGGPVVGNDDYTSTFVVTTVPEPSTWAMAIGGLGVLILLQRRRTRLLAWA